MQQYLDLVQELLMLDEKDNRTGIPTTGKFFNHIEFDIGRNGLPILTTKKMAIKGIIGELIGFIKGTSDNKAFKELKCNVWDDNANRHNTDKDGNITKRNPWLDNPFRKGEDDLGRIYGVQWRNWDTTLYLSNIELYDMEKRLGEDVGPLLQDMGYEYMGYLEDKGLHVYRKQTDQLAYAVDQLINNPTNRRLLISAWNPGEFDQMALAPCHAFMHYQCEPLTPEERKQWCVENKVYGKLMELIIDGKTLAEASKTTTAEAMPYLDAVNAPKYKLNLMTYIRSNDVGLGAPFNITSYGVFLAVMCRLTGHVPGKMHYVTGDTHIYKNHRKALEEQLKRTPIEGRVDLKISDSLQTLEDFENAAPEDFELIGYKHYPPLENKMEMVI